MIFKFFLIVAIQSIKLRNKHHTHKAKNEFFDFISDFFGGNDKDILEDANKMNDKNKIPHIKTLDELDKDMTCEQICQSDIDGDKMNKCIAAKVQGVTKQRHVTIPKGSKDVEAFCIKELNPS